MYATFRSFLPPYLSLTSLAADKILIKHPKVIIKSCLIKVWNVGGSHSLSNHLLRIVWEPMLRIQGVPGAWVL